MTVPRKKLRDGVPKKLLRGDVDRVIHDLEDARSTLTRSIFRTEETKALKGESLTDFVSNALDMRTHFDERIDYLKKLRKTI